MAPVAPLAVLWPEWRRLRKVAEQPNEVAPGLGGKGGIGTAAELVLVDASGREVVTERADGRVSLNVADPQQVVWEDLQISTALRHRPHLPRYVTM